MCLRGQSGNANAVFELVLADFGEVTATPIATPIANMSQSAPFHNANRSRTRRRSSTDERKHQPQLLGLAATPTMNRPANRTMADNPATVPVSHGCRNIESPRASAPANRLRTLAIRMAATGAASLTAASRLSSRRTIRRSRKPRHIVPSEVITNIPAPITPSAPTNPPKLELQLDDGFRSNSNANPSISAAMIATSPIKSLL